MCIPLASATGARCSHVHRLTYGRGGAQVSLRCEATSATRPPLETLGELEALENSSRGASDDETRAVAETLHLLEWPALCKQVACFASTSLAAREIASGGLRIGSSQEESERFVRQTAEARQAALQFGDIYNLHPVVAAAEENGFLLAQHLNAVASTLEAAASLQRQLGMPGPESGEAASSGEYPCLWAVMQPAAGGAPDLVRDIRHCIGEDARVLDRSSPALAAARRRRRENLQQLRMESERWARQMFAQKASENAQVMTQRGRLCVSVRAGRQGELPRGSVKLSASRTGATLYIEPAPLVALNNAEASLAEEERSAQNEVLRQLTASVARHSQALLSVMKAVVELDVITARAQHAAWIGGVAPVFEDARVHLPGARHPLLLQPALPPLPETPEYDDGEFATGFSGQIASPLGMADAAPADTTPQPRKEPPQPVDLCVPSGKTSVIVTGPNTGGKTASLKTLGLLVLMSKAGLYLPLESPGKEARLPWFDRVLADLGDSQDLEQNLSTFSGHVTRVKRITAAVTTESLVLLDELGSGTDPVEGGALAAVLLEWLLPRAGLVFCTSHHGELKELPARDERFVSARVEFDAASLRPTYKLQWGEAGESQALAVAEGLGFDRDIVAQAHEIARTGNLGGRQEQRAGKMKNSLAEEVEDARRQAAAAEQRRLAAEAALHDLQRQLGEMRAKLKQVQKGADDDLRAAQSAAQQRARKLLDGFSQGSLAFEAAAAQLEDVKSGAVEQRRAAGTLFAQQEDAEGYQPRAGETVRLLSMGGATGQVLKGAANGTGKLSVRVGRLAVEVRLSDVAPVAKDSGTPAQPSSWKPRRQKGSIKDKATASGQEQPAKRDVLRVQLPENTADLRGMRQAEAVHALQEALENCPADSVLFVIHGHGTGAIKSAVRQQLRGHSLVKKFYEQPESAGGCTVVEFN